MFCKNCYRLVLFAINRYTYSPQTLQSSSSLLIRANIHNTSNKSFIAACTQVLPKIATNYDRHHKRMRKCEKSELEFDVLSEELIKSTSIAKLFELISLHHSVMNNRHIAETFATLFDLMPDSWFDRRQVLMSAEFQLLCTSALKCIRHFDTYELIKYMKPLTSWGVSPQSVLMQSLLQTALNLINKFSIEQIIFFNSLLTKMTRQQNYSLSLDDKNASHNTRSQTIIPLVDALKLALWIVFQVKIESKEIDCHDINLVVNCLRMACERNVKEDIINKLVDALVVKINELTIEQCFSTVKSLKCLPYPYKPDINIQNMNKLVHICLDKATAIPTNELLSHGYFNYNYIVSLISTHNNQRNFYHKTFFDHLANFFVENQQKFPVYRACYVLNAFRSFDHIHYGLIDYISEQISVNQEFVNDPKVSFVNVLHYFALPANYHRNKPNSAAIYEAIIESPSVNNFRDKEKHLLFKLLRNLCILEYYPRDLIRDCVYNYLEDAVNCSSTLVMRLKLISYLVTLYQFLNTENIDESNKSMTDKLKPYIDEYISIIYNRKNLLADSSPIRTFLSQGLGGQQFVANGVFSEFGHYIDHVIVMRKGGYPVAIGNNNNENIRFIKDLPHPSDCKIIGIIGLTRRDYCNNYPSVLKGKIDHRIKTLKKSGIIPVVINSKSFESMIERERIPFLMREIQEALQQSRSPTNIFN